MPDFLLLSAIPLVNGRSTLKDALVSLITDLYKTEYSKGTLQKDCAGW